jgi:predicted KAP-like P-loop ATPase
VFDFQPDQAISKLESDRLDRAHFVESISSTLIRPGGVAATGVVLGLVGRWGEGKTSILQLLRGDLRERFPKAVLLEFSPWLVSKRHDLLHAFFDELDRSLGAHLEEPIHGSRQSQLIEELSSAIADYLDRVAPVIELLEQGTGKALKLSAFTLKSLSKVYRDRRAQDQKLSKLKSRVELLLKALAVPVVVLVDEVDRIDDQDVRELMHLVKAVADFPAISYVIAYDEVRVAEALGFEAPFPRDRVTRGRKYLEKIVQIPVPLPIIFNEELDRLLDEGVQEVLAQHNIPTGRIASQSQRARPFP